MDEDQKPYHFLKEVIKEKEHTKRGVVQKIAAIAGAAVLFGGIAAITFTLVQPFAQNTFIKGSNTGRVDIPADAEPTPTAEPESEELVQKSEPESEEDELEQYKQLHREMLSVATASGRALVKVNGITNQMDYFNKTYESSKELSGLLIAENEQDLFLLTEYRVVENVERIQVTFWDDTIVDAIYQKHDPNTGLAILKVALTDLDADTREGMELAPLGNSYTVQQGDPILALGSPMGYSDSVVYGVVTSISHKVSTIDTEYTLLTTDIMGSQEGSGILLNLDGKVVGVIAQNYSSEDGNMVVALAVSQIKELMEQLSNKEQMPYIGIKGQTVTSEISDTTGIPKGVLINTVQPDSPAMLFGLKEYDVIVRFDDTKISNLKQYHEALSEKVPGQTVRITAMRKGAEGYVEVPFEVVVGEK